MSSRNVYLVVFILVGAMPFWGQNITLRASENDVKVFESEERRPLLAPIRCDPEQNVYFRRYDPNNPSSPVTKLGSDQKSTTFVSSAVPHLRQASVSDFAISQSGTLYELVQNGNDVYVESFSKDGSSSSRIKLDRQFWAAHMSVLGDGNGFLVFGADLPIVSDPAPRLFTGMFEPTGRLQKYLRFDNDPAEIKRSKPIDSTSEFFNTEASLPLVNGNVEVGSSGNIYLLRPTSPAVIYVLDHTGKLIKTLKPFTPAENTIVSTMHAAGRDIALLYQRTDTNGNISSRRIVVLDGDTGAEKYRYELSDNLGAAFACFHEQAFSFLTVRHGKLAVQTAQPE